MPTFPFILHDSSCTKIVICVENFDQHIFTHLKALGNGDKTFGGVRLREKKYHLHLGHHNKNSFVGKPKDLAVHVWYVNHIGVL